MDGLKNIYANSFYENQSEGSLRSAKEIISILLTYISPKSAVDVGCGVGTWLKVLKESGVDTLTGIDGEWVKDSSLYLSEDHFVFQDLTKKIKIGKKYDLALCMEVLEHLPDIYGKKIIDFLTNASPYVLFSAAVPGQTGAIHINERWQSYWAKEFDKRGFVPIDLVRPLVWDNPKVDFWYKQNTLFYVRKSVLAKNKKLKSFNKPQILNVVHPIMFNIASEI